MRNRSRWLLCFSSIHENDSAISLIGKLSSGQARHARQRGRNLIWLSLTCWPENYEKAAHKLSSIPRLYARQFQSLPDRRRLGL